MKFRTLKYTFNALMIIFALISCEKDDIAITEPQSAVKQDILSFATQEDFDNTLAKVSTMTKAERNAWEKEQGFKSFGTICDEFYKTIDPKSFKSTEEVKVFVAKNSDKIELYTSSDGETYCVTKEFRNAERSIMNDKKMYIIGELVFKKIENTTYTTSISNIKQIIDANTIDDIKQMSLISNFSDNIKSKVISSVVTEDDAYGECVIKATKWYRTDDTYRVHAWIKTELGGYGTTYYTTLSIENLSRSLAIWWFMEAPITYTFNFTISDSNNNNTTTNKSGGSWITSANTSPFYYHVIYNIQNISTPYFSNYYCTVTNTVTDSDGTGHCTATMSK
jgi:hypothetical protein